jgi:hypothetical protein
MGASYGGYVALNPSVIAELFGVAGMGMESLDRLSSSPRMSNC